MLDGGSNISRCDVIVVRPINRLDYSCATCRGLTSFGCITMFPRDLR